MISRKKVFVTGASGFLGSHLCQSFKNKNIDYIGFSRHHGVMVDHVIEDYKELISSYDKNSILINLAGDNTTPDTNEQKLISELSDVYKSNMIFISSSIVYGPYNDDKVSENMRLDDSNDYAKSKALSEEVVLNNKGLILRLSSVYGKGMAENKLFSDIYNQINNESSHLSLRNMNVIKDYLYIDDFCDAMNIILEKPLKNAIMNLGSGIGEKSIKLVEVICKNLHKDFSKLKISSKEDTPVKNILNTDLFEKEYNWTSNINIENGILKWIKN